MRGSQNRAEARIAEMDDAGLRERAHELQKIKGSTCPPSLSRHIRLILAETGRRGLITALTNEQRVDQLLRELPVKGNAENRPANPNEEPVYDGNQYACFLEQKQSEGFGVGVYQH